MRRAGFLGRWAAAAVALAALTARPCSADVSFQRERELGRRFALAARGRLPLVGDPDVLRLVRRVGGRIASHLEDSFFDYHFAVIRDPSINAFAVPGGYVYVHTGLLVGVASEDELAGVLGHEIAHVHAHHLARQQESTQLMSHAALLGVLLSVIHPGFGALASAASAAQQLRYRREFEQEADYLGARYAQAAGYDPAAMLSFFEKLAGQQRMAGPTPPPYLLTHPLTDERMTRLQAVLRATPGTQTEKGERSFELARAHALAAFRQGPPLQVLSEYRQSYQSEPTDGRRAYLYGLVALEAGRLETAGPPLEAARKAGVEAATRELGRLALRGRNADEARKMLRAAVERDPNDPLAWFELGRAEEEVGETGRARDAFRRALDLDPELAEAHRRLGILQGKQGQQGRGFYHLGMAAYLAGEYPRAVAQLERAADILPKDDPDRRRARDLSAELREFLQMERPKKAAPPPTTAPALPARAQAPAVQ